MCVNVVATGDLMADSVTEDDEDRVNVTERPNRQEPPDSLILTKVHIYVYI